MGILESIPTVQRRTDLYVWWCQTARYGVYYTMNHGIMFIYILIFVLLNYQFGKELPWTRCPFYCGSWESTLS